MYADVSRSQLRLLCSQTPARYFPLPLNLHRYGSKDALSADGLYDCESRRRSYSRKSHSTYDWDREEDNIIGSERLARSCYETDARRSVPRSCSKLQEFRSSVSGSRPYCSVSDSRPLKYTWLRQNSNSKMFGKPSSPSDSDDMIEHLKNRVSRLRVSQYTQINISTFPLFCVSGKSP